MPGAIQSSFVGGLGVLMRTLVCLLALVGSASAGPGSPGSPGPASEPLPSETIGITKLAFPGIAGEVVADLQGVLRDSLRQSGFTVLVASVVENRLANEQRLLGCSTPSCYGRLAQVLGVRRVVEGEVQRLELSTFTMKLAMRDLFTGRLVAPPVQERCDVCSNDDVHQMVMRAAQTLAQMAPPTGPQETARPTSSGMLVLETDPPGADIMIDKMPRSERTPASLLLAAGVHELTVSGRGYRTLRRPIEIPPTQQVPLFLVLTPLPQKRPWLTTLSWVGAATAVGLAVTGGVLLHYDGLPVTSLTCPDQPDVMFRCPDKYSFTGGAIASLVGAGVVAIGTGIAFYLDNSAPRRRPILENREPTYSDPPPPVQQQAPTVPPPAGSAAQTAPH